MGDIDFKSELLKVKTINNNRNFESINMSTLSFFHKSYKRSVFNNITIKKKQLTYCAFTSSAFSKCNLQIEQLRNDNLQNCIFTNINFENVNKICSCTFDNSIFKSCVFEDLLILSCNFTNAKFINCTFNNVEFKSSNFDNCVFFGCTFNNLIFVYMNIDYAHFHCCRITNSILSAFQLPYTYGFHNLLASKASNVLINNNFISLSEYKKNLTVLLEYFDNNGESFPTINILYALKRYDYCNKTAYNSCVQEILKLNFNQLKKILLLCNDLCLISYEKRVKLFNLLNNSTEENYEIKEYSECKSLLLGTASKEEILIETGLDYLDPFFNELIKELDKDITELEKNSFHVIQYSHKSPALLSIVLTPIDIISVVAGGITIAEAVINIVKHIYRKIQKRKGDLEDKSQNNQQYNNAIPKEITITSTYYENGNIKKRIEKYKFD